MHNITDIWIPTVFLWKWTRKIMHCDKNYWYFVVLVIQSVFRDDSFPLISRFFYFIFQTFSKLLENEGIETLFRGFPLVHQWTLSSLVCCYLSVFSCVFVCFVSVCLCLFLFALGIDFALNYFMGYASVLCFVVFLEKFIVYIYSLHINL